MSIPFLFLVDGEISLYALAWARNRLLMDEASPAGLLKGISAIGRFYDYYQLVEGGKPLSPEGLGFMLSKFYEARQHGHKHLGWDAVRKKTAVDDVRNISAFSEWCANNFGHVPANPRERKLVSDLNVQEQREFYAALRHRKDWDSLAHLVPATDAGKGIVNQPTFRVKAKRPKPDYRQKYFPPDKVLPLIRATPSVRDRLYFLLLFFGGVRASEPLHLFVTDVKIRPDGTAQVTLGHPETSTYEWADALRGHRTGNRATFLKERYFSGPRNVLAQRHPLHAGWKGMSLDDGSRQQSEVQWLLPEMGRYFAKLHAEYMTSIRRHVRDDHPYYFVNERSGRHFGMPAKLSNMTKAFERAARRIGLSTTDEGVHLHGGRHFYGYFCASQLRLPIETTQMLMHHDSLLSTKVYYNLTGDVARDELRKGQARLASELPSFLDAQRLLLSK
ncbi:site-specific integrase [Paraburkholderia sp. BL9I2N2]|uniref:site-specific integrase n=1 Tax=Paraburkholderia sp. BL9I2N2 TaxID=1938809 RepID=UPI00105128DE|nr:site-specific integrase [Paraburkholderia sp. BL9I2N2]TCK96774.1 phage integrase family protein [Paraburkholderia sp. BL9I2N2]